LAIPPKLAIGDGALGFWKTLAKKWPETATQRCWVYKTAPFKDKERAEQEQNQSVA